MFEPIDIQWKGQTYSIGTETQVMRTLASMQNHISVAQLLEDVESNGHTANHSAYASAFAAALACAGCRVSDIDVYREMFGKDAKGIMPLVMVTVSDIYFALMPKKVGSQEGVPAAKKPKAAKPRAKKPTRKT